MSSAKDDIMKVVSTYFNSILNKDSVTFCNLFALDSVSFFGVNAPDSYQFYSKKNPNTRLLLKDNYRSFIRFSLRISVEVMFPAISFCRS
jgi:hypothetical protein